MKQLTALVASFALGALATATSESMAQKSAFATARFGNAVQVDLPRNWTYLDPVIASHLNTASEATGKIVGLALPQGDNQVLVAANAHDSGGKTRATLRVSVRADQNLTQAHMKEASAMPPAEAATMLRPSADAAVKAMLQVPGVKSYRISELRIDSTGSLICTLSRFEGDFGGRLMISDTWVCPAEGKSIKLSTSYEKALASIYAPILTNVRQTLAVPK